MASRRESRSAATGAHTLQEFENMRRNFKASNDRLARKNNELLAQITALNNQLQECVAENFRLTGEISTLQRTASLRQSRFLAFERERQTMLDLMDEVHRANEWTRKNVTSLRRSFDLIDNPESTTLPSTQKPLRARQSIPSVVGVSKPPDMSRITEGGSDTQGSPHISPNLQNAHSQSSMLGVRPISVPAVKARDSLSLTWSGTPVATGRRAVRRPSGLLDSTFHLRSSPPRRASPINSILQPHHKQDTIDNAEFMPELSPLSITEDNSAANSVSKDRGKLRRKPLDFVMRPQPYQKLDQPGSSLNDVTNASPTARASPVSSMKEIVTDAAEPLRVGIPPTVVHERRTKKPPLATPSLAEDLLMHGNPSDPTPKAKALPTGLLVPPRPLSKTRSPSPANTSGKSETEAASEEEGRERRVRKTVNYAEPKLNTKMRKPEGWDSKNRKSLASIVKNSAAPRSSSPAQISDREDRPISYPPAVPMNHRSSSPLGDVDEPYVTVGRAATHKARRKNIVDDLEADDGEVRTQPMHTSNVDERNEGLRPSVSITPSKATLKTQKQSNEVAPSDHPWSAVSSDFAPNTTNTLARKRKTPSYSSRAPPAATTSDDDERGTDDGDEYVGDHSRATFRKNVSARRSSNLSKRHL